MLRFPGLAFLLLVRSKPRDRHSLGFFLKGTDMKKQQTRPEKTKAPTSLVLQLEDAVLALEAAGSTQDEIFSFVNMILKGFIRNGMFAPEYIDHCRQIIEQRNQPPAPRIITNPNELF